MQAETLRRCFDLEAVDHDRFTAPVAGFPQVPWAYGGILIGQACLAARATGEGRDVRSLHVSFLHSTDADRPVDIAVERSSDRGTFAVRQVRIGHGPDVTVVATALLHHDEEGPEHQVAMPDVVDPTDGEPGHPGLAVEVRDASAGRLMSGEVEAPEMDIWYRAPAVADDRGAHEAMACYIADLSLLETAWRPIPGATIRKTDRYISSTLSHTMWFHRWPHVDDWVLYHSESPAAVAGRSLCTGHLFARDGTLLVSVAQEGLMRIRGVDGS